MKHLKSKLFNALLILYFSQFLILQANATSLTATINTTAISGTDAELALDFLAGDGAVLNSVTISNFLSDGTLGSETLTGGASGSLPGAVTLQNTSFFSEALQSIVLGNSISFNFTLTSNVDPLASLPDAFSVFLLDTSGNSLLSSTDPTGSNSLFGVDIDGTSPGALHVYLADPNGASDVTWSVSSSTTVPEPSIIFLLASGLIGYGFSGRFRSRIV